ncbi:MAG: DUF58 domain-containing protein [Spirochaetales bacterium]|nr:DUF58 domain-containing protein [Spirochaetales bacterium]
MSFISRILLVVSVIFGLLVPYRPVQTAGILCLVAMFLSWLYLRIIRSSILVRRIDPVQRCFRDTMIELTVEFSNKGLLPVSNFRFSDPAGKLFPTDVPRGNITLDAKSRVRLTHRAEARLRGRYKTGPVTVRGRDPLGLFDSKKIYDESGECIVYPRVYPLDYLIEGGVPLGYLRTDNPLYEDVSRYRSIREYVPGDSITHISWKHSAKTGALYTREFLPTYNYNVLLVVNLCADEYPQKQRYVWIERVIELTASMVFHIVGQKQKVGLICVTRESKNSGTRIFPLHEGEAHGMQILEYLACVDPGPECDFFDLLARHRQDTSWNTRLVYAGPLLKEEKLAAYCDLWPQAVKKDFLLAAISRQNLPEGSSMHSFYMIKEFGEFSFDQE